MDRQEDNNKQSFLHNYNFLHDEDFIKWRLFHTKELDGYWSSFLIEHPLLEKELHDAIVKFDAVKINWGQLPKMDKENIYQTVWADILRHKRRRLMRKIGAAAAVWVIILLSVIFFTRKESDNLNKDAKEEIIVGKTLPEEEIYLISGRNKIDITHKSHIDLVGNGKVIVTDNADSQKELLLGASNINKLVVPYGKRANMTLSDGTRVWVNSGTQLDFPSEFTQDTREINVNGEIFIDVAHNSKIPFVVHAADMDIYVHGTSFNVSAYHDDNKKTIVLVEGKVKVKASGNRTEELFPHEKLEMTEGGITKELVNVSEYTSWTKGILEFNETPVSEIFKKIGRYYNVQFQGSRDIKLNDKTCSGKLFLSNNLDSVMTSVSVLSSTNYQRNDNMIHITKK